MEHYGLWSLVPPLVAIVLAIRTRQVYVSLLVGIFLGWVILSGGNPLTGFFATLQGLVDVFKEPSNTRTILFSALVGALIAFVQRSGGVGGFVQRLDAWLRQSEARQAGKNPTGVRRKVEGLAFLTGMLVFVESSISVLTVGALFRPVFDRLKIPREKLAYLADSSSAPSCILIPFNAWGAYIMSLLVLQGFERPFATLISSIPYNFYPLLAVLLVLVVIFTRKDWGPMRAAEVRAHTTGQVLRPGAKPLLSAEVTALEAKPGAPLRMRNMLLPIGLMVLLMPLMLAYTGWEGVTQEGIGPVGHFFRAIGQGSGSSAVLYSVSISLLVSAALYMAQGILTGGELVDLTLRGISDLMPLALLMLLAFAIGNICGALGTGHFAAEAVQGWLSPGLVPAVVFVVSGFVAFSTGTSWGTFAIMISIAIPMAQVLDAPLSLTLAAALGGGIFGDHCSPISDTTILSSMASASDHIDHVRTQLPYALLAAGGALLLYLAFGLLL
ncbi:Na+/H+ antiporter NhaC family protein [Cesiribacter andamanensis]|uniref:Malate-2H(+)/Na(+)-lactate antiporter n=1 Tax=Cesiribacter andamanensis AMV16 TaxID=1279009 RepID=M7NBT3_9BACT|nr:Na+/H+ antiporter NhaC family protein [Cesiribacter andamanensis]EMR04707.1 Malate-2H(+)/Na(+)-lactate antiporter [Cesiribacter andamanensis AMV16]